MACAHGPTARFAAGVTRPQGAEDRGVRVVHAPARADRRQDGIPTNSPALVRRRRAGSDRPGHVRAGHVAAAPGSSKTAWEVSMSLPFAAEGQGENPGSATLNNAESDGG